MNVLYPNKTQNEQQNIRQNTQKTGKYRVLHIDDDQCHKFFLKKYLESHAKIEVLAVDNDADLISLVKNGRFDCVVTDYTMPNTNGIELTEKIRQVSNIPIILYTSKDSEEIVQRAFEAGIDDYIRKEINTAHFHVLSTRVIKAVERHRINEHYKRLIDGVPDAIFIHDFEGSIFDVNKSACECLGYTKDELLKMNIRQIGVFREYSQRIDFLKNELKEKKEAVFDSQSIEKDGSIIPVAIIATTIRYAGVDAVLCFCRKNITKKP